MSPSDVALAYSMAFYPALFARKGTYTSYKCGSFKAPNAYVFMLAHRLTGDYNVVRFRHSKVRYEFYHPELEKVCGAYFDFEVEYKTGPRHLMYVTPHVKVHTPVEEAMIEAAESAAFTRGAKFDLATESFIFGDKPAYMFSVTRYIMDQKYLEEEPTTT